MANNYYPESVKKYKAKAYKQIKVEYNREFVERLKLSSNQTAFQRLNFFAGQ